MRQRKDDVADIRKQILGSKSIIKNMMKLMTLFWEESLEAKKSGTRRLFRCSDFHSLHSPLLKLTTPGRHA